MFSESIQKQMYERESNQNNVFIKDMFSESIQKQMDERESNPNNVVVLTTMIVHEYFEENTEKKEDNSILFRRGNRRMRQIESNRDELRQRIEHVLSQPIEED